MKLFGGNMHPEELQAKEKVINPSRSDEYTDVTVEEKLTGTLLINTASDNKYVDMKRSLINITTQGHNSYPISKASIYTMLYKHVPVRIKNKN